mmetsp:Transcript_41776/g.61824  ORF Transcript_41776/g.61824 Transcript_41776/m.61824 type:complete len:263 (+) Transcript_41776:969-1757(+)
MAIATPSFLASKSIVSTFFNKSALVALRRESSEEKSVTSFSTFSNSALASSYAALASPTFIWSTDSFSLASARAFSAATTAFSALATSPFKLSTSTKSVFVLDSASLAVLASFAAFFLASLTASSICVRRSSRCCVNSVSRSCSSLYKSHFSIFSCFIFSYSVRASSTSATMASCLSDNIPKVVSDRFFSTLFNSAVANSNLLLSFSNCDARAFSGCKRRSTSWSLVSFSPRLREASRSSINFDKVVPRLFLEPPEMVPDGS